MLSISKYYLVLLLLFITSVLKAQSSKQLLLKQLLKQVELKAPILLTDSAAISIKRAQAVEIKSNWLPSLKLSYQADIGTSNNTTGPYFGFGIIPSSSGGIHSSGVTTTLADNLGIAAFDWEIYNFGKYSAENKVAQSEIKVERENFAQSKFNLVSYTILNYLQLLRLQDFLNIQSRNINRTLEIRRSIQSLAKSGVIAGIDTSIAEAELSKARLNYIELDNQLKKLQLQLSAISGINYQSIIPDSTLENTLIEQPSAYLFKPDSINHPLINFYRSVYEATMSF